jgi:hypothetical protein
LPASSAFSPFSAFSFSALSAAFCIAPAGNPQQRRDDSWRITRDHGQGSGIPASIDGKPVLFYTEPQLDERDVHAKKLAQKQGKILSGGTISLQSESHPVEFRKVELLRLEE